MPKFNIFKFINNNKTKLAYFIAQNSGMVFFFKKNSKNKQKSPTFYASNLSNQTSILLKI